MSKILKRYTISSGWKADDGDWINHTLIAKNIEEADFIIGQGGVDINTKLYNEPRGMYTQEPSESRDRRESEGMLLATEIGAIGIGICRNAQLQTALAGGKLIQHVNNHHGSHLCNTIDGDTIYTNSIHHQMCYPWDLPEDEYIILAYTLGLSTTYLNGYNKQTLFPDKAFIEDKLIEPEIIWYPKKKWLAIQFHPEMMWYKNVYEHDVLRYLNDILTNVRENSYYYHETYKQIKNG